MSTVGQRVMQRAVARFGEDDVIARLKISRTSLHEYLNGHRKVSDQLLLLAIDLALDDAAMRESPKRA